MIWFQTALLSSSGGRDHNEDCCGYHMTETSGCWALADGLGGHHGGATASRLAVDAALAACHPDSLDRKKLLDELVGQANRAILARQESEPELASMRTTFTALAVTQTSAAWTHCGDSRVYWFRAGRLCAQTRDHSVPGRLAAAGIITLDQIRLHEDRARLLRSLGSKSETGADTAGMEDAPQAGDAFLLASDGFWEWVNEPEMERDLAACPAPGVWLDRMEDRLRARATTGHDNYSAIAIFSTNADGHATPTIVV